MHVAVPPRDSGSESASSASSSSSSDGSDGGLSDGGESVFSDTEYQRLREASAWKSAIMEVEGNLVAARSVLESPSCPASTQPPASCQNAASLALTDRPLLTGCSATNTANRDAMLREIAVTERKIVGAQAKQRALQQELAGLAGQLIAVSDETEAQLALLSDATYRRAHVRARATPAQFEGDDVWPYN